MTTVAVVGAGLAGLVAAVSLAERGVEPVVFEYADEPGGTTALSSGWVWRYRTMKDFAWGAPHGERALQEAAWDGLPDGLVWLERHGAKRLATGTDNPRTEGVRIDGRQAVEALARRLPPDSLRCGEQVVGAGFGDDGRPCLLVRSVNAPAELPDRSWAVDAVVFAGGGYAADLDRLAGEMQVGPEVRGRWARRNAGLSDGSSMDAAVDLGATRVPVTGEFYGRAMPVGVDLWPDDYVRFSQVYGEHARVLAGRGDLLERAEHDWSDALLVRELARRSGWGWYVLDRPALAKRTPYGTVAKAVGEAARTGALVIEGAPGTLPGLLAEHGTEPRGAALAACEDAVCAVAVRPGITHTLCGVRVDERARVVTGSGRLGRRQVADRVFAAGVEAGGIGTGGYASGLAQAVVLGRLAGESAGAGA